MRVPKRLLLAGGMAALGLRRRLTPPYDLNGKSVLITGGSRGLGLAIAQEVMERGARVTLMSRTPADLARAAQWLGGRNVHTVAGDVTVQADVERAVAEAVRVHGALDVVVSNAGVIQTGPLNDMTEDDFRRIMEVNAFAALRLTRAAQAQLRARRGRVLIVSSVGGKVAVPHLGPYSVSKFASAGLGQALRSELAREGITVTTVLPGLMRTGSARQAEVKGQQDREYALFATLDNVPVLSLDAAVAARRIVGALVRGEAEAMIGGPAALLRYAQALAPELVADVMALGNRFLPGPTGRTDAVKGAEVETQVTRANPLKRAAEAQWNQSGERDLS